MARRLGGGQPEEQEIAGFGEVSWTSQTKPAHDRLGSPHCSPLNALFEAHTAVL